MITPIVKWIGGKSQIIDEVLKKIPDRVDTYWEPFVGGGSVLLSLLQSERSVERCIVSDLNESLVNMYVQIQDAPKRVAEHIRTLATEYASLPMDDDIATRKRQPTSREHVKTKNDLYYYERNVYNGEHRDTAAHAARFIFLNRTGFRGLHRVGKNGHLNTPFGYYKSPKFPSEEELVNLSRLIKRVIFVCGSYEDIVTAVDEGDFVYLDPPYVDTFDGYQTGGFDHDKFFEFARRLPRFCMSNSHNEKVFESFKDYKLDKVEVYQRCHSKNPGLKVFEILVTNDP